MTLHRDLADYFEEIAARPTGSACNGTARGSASDDGPSVLCTSATPNTPHAGRDRLEGGTR